MTSLSNNVWIAIAAPGAAEYLRRLSPGGYTYQLVKQAIKSAETLGVPKDRVIIGPCFDTDLTTKYVHQRDLNRWVESLLSPIDPDMVITHPTHDTHSDHVLLSHSVGVATRPSDYSHITTLHFEPTSIYPQPGFTPNNYVELDECDLEAKIMALECYRDELQTLTWPRNPETIRAKARVRGSESNFALAEAYQLIRYYNIPQ